ncbi:conserved hypothetical protein [Paraburkholderia piptadeniae]|uniref:Uncharacterized protein n=1 Tax=Paraburkholderia piptadeniae TaxID=1701573 RepID=A0A1N7RTV2_9BURK|nr:hypothetical protein [Paraburkholderia piptadeniae]SIT38132.1 conserved hypothetical protein [Paraburkholderia piptadeniae]
MRDVPCIESSSFLGRKTLRMLARDAKHPGAALVYWLGIAEPSHEANFFEATQKFGSLMQLVLPDERPGVFVNRSAVLAVQDFGVVKRLVFKDKSSLEVRYNGPSRDLCDA